MKPIIPTHHRTGRLLQPDNSECDAAYIRAQIRRQYIKAGLTPPTFKELRKLVGPLASASRRRHAPAIATDPMDQLCETDCTEGREHKQPTRERKAS